MVNIREEFDYLLISNSNIKDFPSNKANKFTVRPPYPIRLNGEWEVALRDMHFSHNWYNFTRSVKIAYILSLPPGEEISWANKRTQREDILRGIEPELDEEPSTVSENDEIQLKFTNIGRSIINKALKNKLLFEDDSVRVQRTTGAATLNTNFQTMLNLALASTEEDKAESISDNRTNPRNNSKTFPQQVKRLLKNPLLLEIMETWRGPSNQVRTYHPFYSTIPKGTFTSTAQLGGFIVDKLKRIIHHVDFEFNHDPIVNNNSFKNRTKLNEDARGAYCVGIITDQRYLMNCLGIEPFIKTDSIEDQQIFTYFFPISNTKVPLLDDVSSIFVYSDIIKPQFVGDVKAELLAIVNVPDEPGRKAKHKEVSPCYIPLSKTTIDQINVELHSDTGAFIEYPEEADSKVIIRLRFRPRRFQSFI